MFRSHRSRIAWRLNQYVILEKPSFVEGFFISTAQKVSMPSCSLSCRLIFFGYEEARSMNRGVVMRMPIIAVVVFASAVSAQGLNKCRNADGTLVFQQSACGGSQRPEAWTGNGGSATIDSRESNRNNNAFLRMRESEQLETRERKQTDFEKGNAERAREQARSAPVGVDPEASARRKRMGVQNAPTTRFDQYGNAYTDFHNGVPLINQRTGRPCVSLGGNSIKCD